MKYKFFLSFCLLAIVFQSNGQTVQLTSNNLNEYHLCWSPDGAKLAFVHNEYGTSQLWYIDAVSGEANRVFTGGVQGDFYLSWLNTEEILFDVNNGYGQINLYKVNINGGGPEQITNGFYMMPSVSPDGNWILCSDYNNIYKIPVSGGATNVVVSGTAVFHPSWSFDGQHIVFSKEIDGNSDIWIASANGGEEKQLTFSEDRDDRAAWAPNNHEVYYVCGNYDTSDIVKVNVETLETTTFINEPGRVSYPVFSPDGTKMAYTSYLSGSSEIWVMDITSVGITEPGLADLSVFPNPSQAGFNILFNLEGRQDVRINIHNVAGMLVKSFILNNQQPGGHSLYWQPGEGQSSSAVYYCTIVAGLNKKTEKLVFVK
nr:PD40 domain-containing protein [Bacteroidota bacterium]